MASRVPRPGSNWLTLSEASLVLGITPGTLRRWADRGQVPSFTTPGGHRRFNRLALQRLLPSNRANRPSLTGAGTTAERMTRAYRRARLLPGDVGAPWLQVLSEEDRADFRDRGRRLVRILLEHLDATAPDAARARLAEAASEAEEQGRQAAELGASLTEAVVSFLHFRTPFIEELAGISRRRRLDTRQATALLVEAEAAMDHLLVGLMRGHRLAAES